ncbi:hypothetical protein TVAG_307940 [Trichomonas vaginalis G3]|uniref:Uncharacterized protein n=1 Tax=Trichomonas vaginalis (strain ATCC PRA-98 / G3) TaxID=412133 RepID=A2EGJ3_TRIV3|nr:tricorn protease domain 2 family [Trichomonas vaginalis G3]EAY08188.1 hypothetical protein TVAG_307940 [Trichomonas vaginalis G3]KAI5519769.1 tricorn protease domain 2 family [Trichomonas vaginalis G3]|eukprot:XP_001320411.1 hypothetical protein [Trichomonas vaginalis G3]
MDPQDPIGFRRNKAIQWIRTVSYSHEDQKIWQYGENNLYNTNFQKYISKREEIIADPQSVPKTNPISSLSTINEIRDFFMNDLKVPQFELLIPDIIRQVIMVSSDNIGLCLCLSTYAKSIPLIVQSLLANFKDFPKDAKKFGQQAINMLSKMKPIAPFYPDFEQHYIFNFGLVEPYIATKTSFTLGDGCVYSGYSNNTIVYTFLSLFDESNRTKTIFTSQKSLGRFSLVCINEILLVISADVQSFALNTNTYETVQIQKLSYVQYPCISDGHYIFSISENHPKIKVFEIIGSEAVYIRTVTVETTLNISDCICATNGTVLSLLSSANNSKSCSMYSIIDGRFLQTIEIERKVGLPLIYGWIFDPYNFGHLCLTTDGLLFLNGPSALPPWFFGINIPEVSKIQFANEHAIHISYLNQLLLLAIYYLGSGIFPMSNADQTVIVSLLSLMENQIKSSEFDPNIIHAILIILLSKCRQLNTACPEIYGITLQFFNEANKHLRPLRKHMSFVYLSLYNMIPPENDKIIKIFNKISADPSCSEILVMLLDIKSIDQELLSKEFVQNVILNLLKLKQTFSDRVTSLLWDLITKLIDAREIPEVSEKIDAFVINLVAAMNNLCIPSKGAVMTNLQFSRSPTLIIYYRLLDTYLDTRKITTDIVAKNINSLSILTICSLDPIIDRRISNILAKNIFLTYLQLLDKIYNDDEFIRYKKLPQKVFHPQFKIKNRDNVTDLVEKCLLDSIGIANQSNIETFLTKISNNVKIGIDSFSNLSEKVKKLEDIQPQPLRKIIRFLEDPDAKFNVHGDEAMQDFLKSVKYYHDQTVVDYDSVVGSLLFYFDALSDDILCLSQEDAMKFVRIIPSPLSLPYQILVAADYKMNENQILALKLDDLCKNKEKIIQIYQGYQNLSLLQPLISTQHLVSVSESVLNRALSLSCIYFSSDNVVLDNKIYFLLQRILQNVTGVTFPTFLDLCRIIISKGYDVISEQLSQLIIDIISRGLMKDKSVLPKVNESSFFKCVFTAIDTARILLSSSTVFSGFISSVDSFSREMKIAVFAICQNSLFVTRNSKRIEIILQNTDVIKAKDVTVSVDSTRLFLENGKVIETRVCKSIKTFSEKFKIQKLKQTRSIFDCVLNFGAQSEIEKVLKYSCLVEFTKLPELCQTAELFEFFKGNKISPTTVLDQRMWHFSNSFFKLPNSRIPPFQISSAHSSSVLSNLSENDKIFVKGEIVSNGEFMISSPILSSVFSNIVISIPIAITVQFFMQGKLRNYSSSLSYKQITLNFEENSKLEISFDPQINEISVKANGNAHVFPMYPSVEYYAFCLIMPESNCPFSAEFYEKEISETNAYKNLNHENFPSLIESSGAASVGSIFDKHQLHNRTNLCLESLSCSALENIARNKGNKLKTKEFVECLVIDDEMDIAREIALEIGKEGFHLENNDDVVVYSGNITAIPVGMNFQLRDNNYWADGNKIVKRGEGFTTQPSLIIPIDDIRCTSIVNNKIANLFE